MLFPYKLPSKILIGANVARLAQKTFRNFFQVFQEFFSGM